MKDKLLIFALVISIAFNVSACSDAPKVEARSERKLYSPTSVFQNAISGYMVVDSQTNVEYWYINGEAQSLTLLVDQEGKPLVYKGE